MKVTEELHMYCQVMIVELDQQVLNVKTFFFIFIFFVVDSKSHDAVAPLPGPINPIHYYFGI